MTRAEARVIEAAVALERRTPLFVSPDTCELKCDHASCELARAVAALERERAAEPRPPRRWALIDGHERCECGCGVLCFGCGSHACKRPPGHRDVEGIPLCNEAWNEMIPIGDPRGRAAKPKAGRKRK